MANQWNTTQIIGRGMDYGTRTCYMAYCVPGQDPVVPNLSGIRGNCIPSLFYCDPEGQEWVGDQAEARDVLINDPDGTCECAKMRLKEKSIELNGKVFTPAYINTQIARHVIAQYNKAFDEDFIGSDYNVLVVGIPNRFDAGERGTYSIMLRTASGSKQIILVSEAILAAEVIAYFEEKANKGKPIPQRPKLVTDWGHGTFDAVLLIPNENPTPNNPHRHIAKNPDGLNIAGHLMDERMADLLLSKLWKNPGNILIANMQNRNHRDWRRLMVAARNAKEALSNVDEYTVQIHGTDSRSKIKTVTESVHVTRAEFEAVIRDDIQKTVDLSYEVLQKAGLGTHPDIDIVMVGGTSYIPLVRQLLQEKFHWLPADRIKRRMPEKAVALGAALYAQNPNYVAPKVAYGYAVNTYNPDAGHEMLHVQIPSNADLPKTVRTEYETRGETSEFVPFSIYEVREGRELEFLEMDRGVNCIYTIRHNFARPVPRGTCVELKTTLSESGTLTVTVTEQNNRSRFTQKTFDLHNRNQI